MNQPTRCLFCLILLFLGFNAWAHKASDSFLYLDQTDPGQSLLRVDLALRDMALVVPLDSNGDQKLTGAELRAAREQITRYVEQGITLTSRAGNCQLKGDQWGLSRHSDGPYAAAAYRISCPNGAAPETLRYNLLFDTDPLHRGLLQHRFAGGESLAVLAPDKQTFDWSTGAPGQLTTFANFLWQGVIHLLLGYDHVLFLLVLILPATMPRTTMTSTTMTRRKRMGQTGDVINEGVSGSGLIRERLIELVGIVTAFTVAHSITLGLAALDIVRPPIAWIEIIIALSIALAALNMFWPVLGRKTWKLAFGFGLIHGFGFASVLGDLTSGTSQMLLALAGFNIGVELGQLALLVVLFPALFWLSRYALYQRAALPAMALAVSGISLVWVAERVAQLS